VRIQDLARQMISLSGLKVREEKNPNGDIEIQYTGLRPGEKLYEELLIDEENTEITSHKRILRSVEKHYPLAEIRSEEHTSELQSRENLVCRLLLEKKKNKKK